ncbi:MAG TPA: AAA family ATPase [Candidatus Paceibacterota bacterium]|nr:AAA family ATPase [Candidatus Paceibacterota bacterium]
MILGITGTIGAGKGTVVEYLVKEKGFTHYSVREAITEEILRRGLPVTRPNLNEVATDLRRTHGPTHFGDHFRARAEQDGVKDYIIESIRNPKEAEKIKSIGGFIIIVDADEHLRYDRVKGRGSHTDDVTFEEFQAHEAREMTTEDPSDPSFMDIAAVMRMADATIMNDGTLEELHAKIDEVLATLS